MKSNEFVPRAFITGLSHVPRPGLSGPNNVEACKFSDHSFAEFSGLTEGEVTNIVDKLKIEEQICKMTIHVL
jgi:hypothetical protein